MRRGSINEILLRGDTKNRGILAKLTKQGFFDKTGLGRPTTRRGMILRPVKKGISEEPD